MGYTFEVSRFTCKKCTEGEKDIAHYLCVQNLKKLLDLEAKYNESNSI